MRYIPAIALFSVLWHFNISPAMAEAPKSAAIENGWMQEFADVCADTHQAMDLNIAEIEKKLKRCEGLRERLSELNGAQGSAVKTFTRRLDMCMEFYKFMLDYKRVNRKEE